MIAEKTRKNTLNGKDEKKERIGKERKGKKRKGKERKGKEREGKEGKGKERKGKGGKDKGKENKEMEEKKTGKSTVSCAQVYLSCKRTMYSTILSRKVQCQLLALDFFP